MIPSHLDFIVPADNTVIWRFLELYKYESLVETSSFYFSCVEDMADKQEGMFPLMNGDFSDRTDLTREQQVRASANYLKMTEKVRPIYNRIYLNCWFIGADETPAMWAEYVKKNNGMGVAIKSTVKRLKDCFVDDSNIQVGLIDYVDHARYRIDDSKGTSLYQPFLIKANRYRFESELRVIYTNTTGSKVENIEGKTWPIIPLERIEMPKSVMIPCKLHRLIKDAVVSPNADDAFVQHVRRFREIHRRTFPIIPSSLR